jgi:transposase
MFYHAANHHPLKHLLMIGFLFNDFKHFLLTYKNAKNLENLNISPANANTSKEISDGKKHMVELLRQGHSLRQTAKMTGKSIGHIKKIALSHQIFVKIRPKKIYKGEIRTIWRKLYIGHSTQKIAKQFSISVGAVEQILSAHPYLAQLRTKIRFFNMRKMHREQLESFLINNPTATRNQIRLNVNASYLWLFKNDHCWLYENLPISLTVLKKSNEKNLALG